MIEPRRIPIHRSLSRPILLAGGERELVMVNAVIVAALVFGAGFTLPALLTAALFGVLGHLALVRMAKLDPQLRAVYARHIHYQDYYPARASEHAPPALVRTW
jgi:type IV secretory pathway TrbD component